MAGPDDQITKAPPTATDLDDEEISLEGDGEKTDPHIDVAALMRGETDTFGEEAQAALSEDDPRRMMEMRQEFLGLKSPHDPRAGECTYLIVDLESIMDQLKDESSLRTLLSETKLVLNAKGYHVETNPGERKLTILGTVERSENSMLAIAQSLSRQIPMARIFLGNGEISHPPAGGEDTSGFVVYETPMASMLEEWRTLSSGVYLKSTLAYDIKDPNRRKGSHSYIETSPARAEGSSSDFTGLVKLDKYEPKLRLISGGPDKLIGYKEELEALDKYMRDDESRLILLKGEAGMGKSRVLATALQNMPSAVVCSLDAADKNLAGSSLVTIADQLAYILKDEELPSVIQFSKKSRSEKITLAQTNPKKVFDMCIEALAFLNMERGEKTIFVLEDIHFADRHSEQWTTKMVSEYLSICSKGQGKVLFTMRPEEMYTSDAQKNIADMVTRTYGEKSTKTIKLGGLNFADPKVSEEFAFHSIPKEKRERADGTPKRLGLWHETLGKKAGKSPFRMKTFMDTVNEGNNLITTGEVIEVKREAIAEIEQIEDDGDLSTHYRERIERLEGKSKLALQYIGLLGGKITFQQLLTLLSKQFLGTEDSDFVTIAIDLEKGGYICLVPGQPKDQETYTLQHDSIRKAAVDSIPPEERGPKALLLYRVLRDDEILFHPDAQFELLHHVATDRERTAEETTGIWDSLERVVNAMIADANDRNSSSKAYAVAEAILDGERGVPVIRECLAKLKTGEQVPKKIQSIILKVLEAKAASAVYLGKAQDARTAITDLKTIHGKNPALGNIGRIHLMEFEIAYIADAPSKAIIDLFDQHIAPDSVDLPPAEKLIAQIKLLAKLNRNQAAIDVFNEAKPLLEKLNREHQTLTRYVTPYPPYMEARRLAEVRCPFEIVREVVKNFKEGEEGKTLDEDVMLHRGAITEEQAEALRTIQEKITELLQIKEKHPLIFDRYAEMGLLGIHGQIEAYLGNFEAARKGLAEAWRQSDQAEVPLQGIRYAKMEGDIAVIQALSSQDREERIRLFFEAYGIYSGKCMGSLAQIDERSFYQAAIRIQRIRNIGRLLLEYDLPAQSKPIPMKTKQKLKPYITQAIRDFEHVNAMYVGKFEYLSKNQGDLTNPDPKIRKKYQNIKDEITEVHYYMIGYIGHIVKTIKDLGFEVPPSLFDATKNPFATHALDGDTFSYSAQKSDKGFGDEVSTKTRGLVYLITGR